MVWRKFIGLFCQVKGVVTLSNTVLELFRYLGLGLEVTFYESWHAIEHVKRHIDRIYGVCSIEQIQSALLDDPADDKLVFLSVWKEKLLPLEREVYLARLVHVVEYASIHKAPRSDPVIHLDYLFKRVVFPVESVLSEFVRLGYRQKFPLGVPPQKEGRAGQFVDRLREVRPVIHQSCIFIWDS